ncbi:MAG: efflux RND transporter permease subunit, partial [Pseudomonadota bacterium]
MNGLISWWAKNGVAANLLMAFIVIIGLLSFGSISREAQPPVTPESISVYVTWPGASPNDVEEQIIIRIEETVANMDGIKRMSAFAYEGRATFNIEMDEGEDFDAFLNEIKARVD